MPSKSLNRVRAKFFFEKWINYSYFEITKSGKWKIWICHLLAAVSSVSTMSELLYVLKSMHHIYYSTRLVELQLDVWQLPVYSVICHWVSIINFSKTLVEKEKYATKLKTPMSLSCEFIWLGVSLSCSVLISFFPDTKLCRHDFQCMNHNLHYVFARVFILQNFFGWL